MRIIYQPPSETTFHPYRCPLSGRAEFDLIEASHKARRLVRSGNAVEARVLDGEQLTAQWFRQGSEIVQGCGPDL